MKDVWRMNGECVVVGGMWSYWRCLGGKDHVRYKLFILKSTVRSHCFKTSKTRKRCLLSLHFFQDPCHLLCIMLTRPSPQVQSHCPISLSTPQRKNARVWTTWEIRSSDLSLSIHTQRYLSNMVFLAKILVKTFYHSRKIKGNSI